MNELPQRFLALDVGALYLKFAFCQKTGEQLRTILWGKEELNVIFWKRPLERIWPTIQQSYFSFTKKEKTPIGKVILSFSPTIFKAAISEAIYNRKNPKELINTREAQAIEKEMFRIAEEKMREALFQAQGIRQEDFVLQNFDICKMKIDGYEVQRLEGFRGTVVQCKVLGTFLPLEYVQKISSLAQQYALGQPHFIHEIQMVHAFSKRKNQDGIFIDIGDKTAQIVVIKKRELVLIKEIAWGSDIFTQKIVHLFGMRENTARELKEEYAKGKLSDDARKRVRELFLPEVKNLVTLVRESLDAVLGVLPYKIFLFGGGSLLPEIKEVFEQKISDGLSFFNLPEIALLLPKDIASIEGFNQTLNPLYTPLFLESYATT